MKFTTTLLMVFSVLSFSAFSSNGSNTGYYEAYLTCVQTNVKLVEQYMLNTFNCEKNLKADMKSTTDQTGNATLYESNAKDVKACLVDLCASYGFFEKLSGKMSEHAATVHTFLCANPNSKSDTEALNSEEQMVSFLKAEADKVVQMRNEDPKALQQKILDAVSEECANEHLKSK